MLNDIIIERDVINLKIIIFNNFGNNVLGSDKNFVGKVVSININRINSIK